MSLTGNVPLRHSSSEERQIRVNHALVGRNGNSVDEVSSPEPTSVLEGDAAPIHPFGVLLNFTMKGGQAVNHPDFGERAVSDICAQMTGKIPFSISRLNSTDFLIGFEAADNPTLFATGVCRPLQWLDIRLQVDAHIGAMETLGRVSREREEARRIINDTLNPPVRPEPPVSVQSPPIEVKTNEISEREILNQEKEDAMLKVLESMTRKIEQIENVSKQAASTSAKLISDRVEGSTPSTSQLMGGHRRDGVVLMEQLPRVGHFSGEKPVPKSEIDFKTWVGDVQGNLQNYPEPSLRQGVRSSLRGLAKELLEGLPSGATVHDMLEVLKKQYGTVESSDQLLTNFYQLTQEKGEEIANFAARLVGALNKIQRQFPQLVPREVREERLRERLFHGMLRPYRDALRYLYSNKKVGYYDFLEEARKVQECDGKAATGSTTVKSKSAQVEPTNGFENDSLVALKSQVEELTVAVKSAQANGPPYRGKKGKDGRDLKGPEKSSAGPFRGRDRPIQCYGCGGWGHIARECPSPGNFPRGEGNPPQPPPENRQQGQRDNQRQAPTAPQQAQNRVPNPNPNQNQ